MLFSTLKEGWKLAYNGYNNERKSYLRKQQWKIAFNILLNPSFSKKWFQQLRSNTFKPIFAIRPQLYIKPYRPYISIAWDKQHKIKVISDTYEIINTLPKLSHTLLIDNKAVLLSTFSLSDDSQYNIKLGYVTRFRKEGEWVIYLESADSQKAIVSAAFSFEKQNDQQWDFIIGCIQGSQNKQELKTIQKQMHGLRPKSFILLVVQKFARQLGANNIYGVADLVQPYRRKHAINLPWFHAISFNYDQFWQESGGEKINKEWFKLDLDPQLKDIQEVKSKKRSMYRKRYAMLDNVFADITTLLS